MIMKIDGTLLDELLKGLQNLNYVLVCYYITAANRKEHMHCAKLKNAYLQHTPYPHHIEDRVLNIHMTVMGLHLYNIVPWSWTSAYHGSLPWYSLAFT